jgi:hypothetical protein
MKSLVFVLACAITSTGSCRRGAATVRPSSSSAASPVGYGPVGDSAWACTGNAVTTNLKPTGLGPDSDTTDSRDCQVSQPLKT